MNKIILTSMAIVISGIPLIAQGQADEPKLKIAPTGRILMDGALYAGHDDNLFKAGFAITDVRAGVKANYGKWTAKIDIGYAYGKVGLKDIYLQYNFNESGLLRIGSFIHQYGLQSSTSSSMKPTMEEPTSNAVFNNPRQIGFMYEYSCDKVMATASFHVEPSSLILTPNQMNQEGYGILSRVVARPLHELGKVVQVGISGGFATPQYDSDDDLNHHSFTMAGNFPTHVSKVKALSATVNNAMNLFKFTPELLLSYGPVALEAQYFFNRVNRRHNLHAFTGQGAYATLRGLILGGEYGYSMLDGNLSTPQKGALECVLSYNHTSLTNSKAEFYGGRLNDISCTFNYYINKYMLFRFRYAYTHRWDSNIGPKVNLSSFQARLQVIF